ncbi:MAG: FIST C-terminal domain-containing protein [Rubrivivax sp.]|jgi:small ligand-binding sensory domain FIST|nr:FIST C-terminal domain-containing protein [Rubrivivax sp.]
MTAFLVGHATHPDWRMALTLAAAQIDGARTSHERSGAGPLTLGFVYFTDAYAPHAQALLDALRARWPGIAWVGCVGVGVAAGGVEYFDEPALALMLAPLPSGRFEVFSGAHPLSRIAPYSALVHADPQTPDLSELIAEMSDRTLSGYLFGGLASSRAGTLHIADGVWRGGLSGVAFSADVPLVSRVTQGCQPVGPVRVVTSCERNVVVELDGQPALPLLLGDLRIADLDDPRQALPRLRATLAGLSQPQDVPLARGGQFGTDVRVRHLVGIDPGRSALAVAEVLQPGMRLAFCARDVQAARRDLVRICTEIRDELESPLEPALQAAGGGAPEAAAPRRILGAIYVSCAGRGGPHFGGPSAELRIVRHALGDVPLVGFFAGGEIARHHLYGYTGVLTVFTGGA